MKRTKSMLLTAILMSCLLIFGAMAPVLAAAPAQTDESGEIQVWASNLYPAADAPGMMEIVALYPNNAAELVTIYLTRGTIVETGSWETNADGGVDVTLTGNEDVEYQQPALLRLVPTDDQLTDGIFTYRALTVVTPEEMDAMLEGAATDVGAAAESDVEAAPIGEVDSVWVSHVYPAADAAGLITVLALYANGNLEQTSIYLTKGVVTEVGEWEEDADGAIAVTVTGTTDEAYAEPNTTTYTIDGDALVDGAFALTRWLTVTPEDMLATADPVGTYVTNVYPAADAAGYVVVLSLYANNNAEQTTIYLTKGAVTEVGVWEIQDDGSISVTITGSMDEAYEQESVTIYRQSGDMLQNGAFFFFKLSEISPAMMDAMLAPAVAAVFQSDVLPAASSPGRIITLTLYADNTLTMSSDYLNEEAPIVQVGAWQEDDNGALTVTLTGQEDTTYDEPVVIVFELDDEGNLVAVEYDESLFGSEGLTLTERPIE
ncbi:MAG: copper resistance protein NlpE N-terminal domain-containing protein [Caldilinea sp.]|nr:copper resistance protein NlpE N-terminal domain-containing protein [Caldilinea sp.]